MGVSFHVGSQCMRPSAFQAAMSQPRAPGPRRRVRRCGRRRRRLPVGLSGHIPPDLAEYTAAIDRGFAEMMVHETTELWCEPGRALVAEARRC